MVVVFGVLASPALASYPTVTPSSLKPGGTVKISGKINTCKARSTVKLTSDAVARGQKNVVKHTRLSSNHSYSQTFAIGAGVPRGAYFIEVQCAGRNAPPGHFHVT
jgi:hypothetical protein